MTVIFGILAVVISLLLPKSYTATVTLLPPEQNSSMASAMTSPLAGIAALASGSVSLKSPVAMLTALLSSRTVEDAMVQHFGLMQVYHRQYLSDARIAFERQVSVDGSGKDGLLRITVTDGDARHAADLANGYVDQLRIISEHLALTEASQRRASFERKLEEA